MVKFYIQQLITEAILPLIKEFDQKESMMVISAFSPTTDMFSAAVFLEDRAYLFKLVLVLESKCHWFT